MDEIEIRDLDAVVSLVLLENPLSRRGYEGRIKVSMGGSRVMALKREHRLKLGRALLGRDLRDVLSSVRLAIHSVYDTKASADDVHEWIVDVERTICALMEDEA